jgi:hypothetical protein
MADAGAAGVPPLVQVFLVVVELGRAAVAGAGQQLVDGGCAVEAADGPLGQAGLAGDRLDAQALGAQRLDQLPPLPGPPGQRRVVSPPGGDLLEGGLPEGEEGLGVAGRVIVRLGLPDALAVPGDGLLRVLSQVVPQVPAIRDLDRRRRPVRAPSA